MKFVVIGGTGLIGSKVVSRLRQQGHGVVAASPSSGVNALTGEGLREALAGAEVVIDVANSPSFEDQAVLRFFELSGSNLLAAEAEAGVKHHVALSIVGADGLPDSGYMRAKIAQEKLIQAGGTPYTIVRATQFLEFVGAIAESGLVDGTIRLPTALLQPIAADDVAGMLVDVALGPPRNRTLDIAGPDPLPMDEAARRYLGAKGDPRPVVGDPDARYFGAKLTEFSLVPREPTYRGSVGLGEWLQQFSGSAEAAR